jgi:hypothetical protein
MWPPGGPVRQLSKPLLDCLKIPVQGCPSHLSDPMSGAQLRVGEPRNRAAYGGGEGSDINTKGEELRKVAETRRRLTQIP